MININLSNEVKEISEKIIYNKILPSYLIETMDNYFEMMSYVTTVKKFCKLPYHRMTHENNFCATCSSEDGHSSISFTIAQNSTIYIDIVNDKEVSNIITPEVTEKVKETIKTFAEEMRKKWLTEMDLRIRFTWNDFVAKSNEDDDFITSGPGYPIDSSPMDRVRATEELMGTYLTLFKDFGPGISINQLEEDILFTFKSFKGRSFERFLADSWESLTELYSHEHPAMIEFKQFIDKVASILDDDPDGKARGRRRLCIGDSFTDFCRVISGLKLDENIKIDRGFDRNYDDYDHRDRRDRRRSRDDY